MKFTDYRMRDLPGKIVVWKTNDNPQFETRQTIETIENADKFGFTLIGKPGRVFSYRGGFEVGKKKGSQCQLVTRDQADKLRKEWGEIGVKKAVVDKIMANRLALLSFSTKDLQAISDKIDEVIGVQALQRDKDELAILSHRMDELKAKIGNK